MFQYKEGLLPAISCGTWVLRSLITYKLRVVYEDVLGRENIIEYISQFVKLLTWQTTLFINLLSLTRLYLYYFIHWHSSDGFWNARSTRKKETIGKRYWCTVCIRFCYYSTTKKVNSKKDSNIYGDTVLCTIELG